MKLPVIDKHDIRFVRLSVNGESLQSRINGVVQDDYGFLWFGTSDGLFKYDGYRIKSYRRERGNPNSLADDTILTLYKDRDGSIWIGSRYGGLDRLDPGQDTFTHYRHSSGNPGSLSSDFVTCVYRDRGGRFWIGTSGGLDRLEPSSGTFVHYRHNTKDLGSLSGNGVNSVYEDRRGSLWVGTSEGLNKLDPATGRVVCFLHDSANPHSIGNNYVASILEDRAGVLWVTSPMGSGLSALDVTTGQFTRYSFHVETPASQSVTGAQGLFEDQEGALWICTIDRGLLKLDRDRKTFTRYSHDPGDPNSLPHDTVYTLFEDAEGQMWVGAQSGLGRFQSARPSFSTYRHSAVDPNSLRNNMIWSVGADSQGFLWVGDEDGLNQLDPRTGKFMFFRHEPKDPYSLSYNKVAAIREDQQGTLWFGTYGAGLDRFDRATGRFFPYRHDPNNPASLSSDSVLSLLIDRQGTLWVGTQGGGLDRFDARTGRFTAYLNDPPDPNLSLTALLEDRAGMLWVASGQGLRRFNPKTGQITTYHHNSEDPRSISNDKVNGIWEDRRGRLWVGTRDGLNLVDSRLGTATIFNKSDGLPDDAIESILEDGHGYLWLGTHNGLSRFDPQTKTFRNYGELDGLSSNLLDPYGPGGSCQTSDGEMVFATSNGVTTFYPDLVAENSYVPPIRLTDLLLFNQAVHPGKDSPLSRSIWATDSLTLKEKQGNLTLEFAALSYVAPERNHYRYRLEGLEPQWNAVDSGRRSVTYTNLDDGKYTFRVQGSNNDGVWNTTGATLAITVLPDWWETWWFDSLLALTIAGLTLVVYRSRMRVLHRQTARLESQVAQRTHELEIAKRTAEEAKDAAEQASQAKTAFLASMSHELRNPLNAILGFSNLLRESPISEKQRRDLDIINRSGEHLLSLINDVLDMAKIDSGRITIENAPLDLGDLVNGIIELMRVRVEEKGLELSAVRTATFCPFVEADGEKLREVLINLVSNAVKYTERGGVILRVASESGEDSQHCRLVMEVVDTGIGIASADHARIFEPFVQVGKLSTQKGTGLGLAISKKFVELMGGTIQVESSLGKGSLFRVEIPVRKLERYEMPGTSGPRGRVIGLEPGQPDYRVLIVEDQEENWLLLQRLLEKTGFYVQVAEDAATGIEKFLTWQPHFIWMDWGLPGMDGLEATRRIRQMEGGRDVKIAILSAFAFNEYREEALGAGADDFVSKPFQAEELLDCVARHLPVRYEYQTEGTEKTTSVLNREALMVLPGELRKELADAIISLDGNRIADVIQRIAEQNASLASALAQYADRSAYSPILEALESSEAVRT